MGRGVGGGRSRRKDEKRLQRAFDIIFTVGIMATSRRIDGEEEEEEDEEQEEKQQAEGTRRRKKVCSKSLSSPGRHYGFIEAVR